MPVHLRARVGLQLAGGVVQQDSFVPCFQWAIHGFLFLP
jgi:hypothetical protein